MNAGFGEIAEKLRRATVQVRCGRRGMGSGVIWDSSGTVVTNAHVAISDRATVELWDGREYEASLCGQDRRRDLAKLEIDARSLEPAQAGESGRLRPGALVIAIGNPLGFAGALTRGVVHGVGPVRDVGGQTWIQAAIRLAPGNSGGPLADAEGRVVGINTMVYGGLGLAMPSAEVTRFLREGAPQAVRLGVTLRPVQYGTAMGLLVLEVERDSVAARASLLVGDVLLGADGRRFTSLDDLWAALERQPEALHLEFVRGGGPNARTVTALFERRAAAA